MHPGDSNNYPSDKNSHVTLQTGKLLHLYIYRLVTSRQMSGYVSHTIGLCIVFFLRGGEQGQNVLSARYLIDLREGFAEKQYPLRHMWNS